MKISSLKPGDTAYVLYRHKMGNTTLSTLSVFQVSVKEVHDDYVIANINGNASKKYRESEVAKWKKNKPVLIRSRIGNSRLATKSEKEALKNK
ncbi:hypothetical protein [Pantoea dispersa]|uniref:hypothetical protein n=1 Tax=Pantoea dispersa TaxID=59814 RepID=UPI0021C8D39D|nr:hypothetical protein [Pantoea dispersa]